MKNLHIRQLAFTDRAENQCQRMTNRTANMLQTPTSGVCDGSIISTSRGTSRSSFNHCITTITQLFQHMHAVSHLRSNYDHHV